MHYVDKTKDSFPLRAWNGVFFVSFIDFFASLNASSRKEVKRSKKQRMLHSTLVAEVGFKSVPHDQPWFYQHNGFYVFVARQSRENL